MLWKASKPENDIRKDAEAFALEKKALAVVHDSYAYNGNSPYVTVLGVDEYGEEKAIFVPITLKEDAMQEVFLADGITKEQAIAVLTKTNEVNVKEILHTKLGYEEAGAVWEITYKSKQEKLNYVYILFEDGQWWKRILNL